MKIKTITPCKLPISHLDWKKLEKGIKKAHAAIEKFNASGASLQGEIPNKVIKKWARRRLSSKLLCEIHKVLTPGKGAGKLRKKQNWIGPQGCQIEEAYFYPPAPEKVPAHMNQLHRYLRFAEKDLLVQLAIYIAQLLIIHPFMDGNGRVARAAIPLFLSQKKLTSGPLFCMNTYFQKHRLQYLQKLYAITAEDKWMEWILFFLNGIVEQTKNKKVVI